MSDTFVAPWTVAHQALLSMEFPRQEYWSGLPFPSPGDLSDPGIGPRPPVLAGGSLPLSHQRSPTLTCSWASSSNTNLFYSKVLNASCNLLNTVLKVKDRVIVWVGNGCKYIGCLPSKSWCSLVAMVLLLLPSIVRGYCTILSTWEKIKIQNLKYIYY